MDRYLYVFLLLILSFFKFNDGWFYSVLINDVREVRIKGGGSDIHDLILNYCAFKAKKYGTITFGFKNINCR